LDWLRVCAILTVFVFHCSRFFDTDDWHVKNPTTYFGVQVWITILANWLMPVIFVISGASLFYATGSRGVVKFVVDKVRRLLVPLVVGIFTHVILQVYLERLAHGQFSGSLFAFIPHYFDGWYGFGGNFAWMGLHLWYLLILFVYTLLLYPLFRWLLTGSGRIVLRQVGDFLALPGSIYLLAIPVAALRVLLDPGTFLGMGNFGGWPLPIYLLFFLYGFVVMSHDGLQRRIRQLRWISLAVGALCVLSLLFIWASQGDPFFGTSRYTLIFGIFSLSAWCWILAFFGFAHRHLAHSTPFLTYANEAVLPFYILHQTVLLVSGYFITRWAIPDLLKFLAIGISAFGFIGLVYEYLIRRNRVLRVLFGMRP
jgi:hypothetical protein